jgi:drug/metabolite transporter (DMT)-like permease
VAVSAGRSTSEERRGTLLVLLSAIAYGTLPVFARLAFGRGMTLAGLLAWRFVLAVLGFTVAAGGLGPRLPFAVRLRLWSAGLIFVLNSVAYFLALRRVPVSLLSLILYTYPVIVTLLSAAAGIEVFRLRNLIAALLALVGAALTATGSAAADPLGLLLAFGSALLYSIYIVAGTRLARGVPTEAAAAHVAHVSLAVYLPWAAFVGELAPPPDAAAWGAVVAIGTFSTVVALRSFLAGLQRLGPSRAAVLSCFEIVVTLTLAATVLGEPITPRLALGATLIVGAVLLEHVGRS